jgi:hypothetical protein
MNFTAAQLAQLRRVYASGALETEDKDGKRVRFRSLADLAEIISTLERAARGTRKSRVGYFSPKQD